MSHDVRPTTDDLGETPPVSPAEQIQRIRFALDQAESHLARTAPSVTRWRLTRALQLMRFTLDSWSKDHPSQDQLAYARERATVLMQLARQLSPTLPCPRSE